MDCENVIEIKTQEGDRRGKEEIKGATRKLHNNATCCGRNAKSIKSAIAKGEVVKKQHRNVLANGYEMIDGKKVLCNTKEKREQLRNARKQHQKNSSKNSNWDGTGRLERYRIPEKLIEDLFNSQKIASTIEKKNVVVENILP